MICFGLQHNFKDEAIKFKAKKVSQLLNFYYGKYTIVNYEKDWDDVININLKTTFFLSQAVAKQFVEQKTGGKTSLILEYV